MSPCTLSSLNDIFLLLQWYFLYLSLYYHFHNLHTNLLPPSLFLILKPVITKFKFPHRITKIMRYITSSIVCKSRQIQIVLNFIIQQNSCPRFTDPCCKLVVTEPPSAVTLITPAEVVPVKVFVLMVLMLSLHLTLLSNTHLHNQLNY